jgi:SMC interacting uncharacterized protein involved in chromosome segregation
MKKFPLSAFAAALPLAMSLWLAFATLGNARLQEGGRAKEEEIQTLRSKIQALEQRLQEQQQQIDTTNQLANQIGPAILRDLVDLQAKNGNIALAVFLQKHGVQFGSL